VKRSFVRVKELYRRKRSFMREKGALEKRSLLREKELTERKGAL
jgi:hypothetical protein